MKNFRTSIVVLAVLLLATPLHLIAAEAGVFKSSADFRDSLPYNVGPIIEADHTAVKFKTSYSSMTYTSKQVWGYVDEEGNLFRSIDHKFYKIEQRGSIWLYSCTIDGEQSYKISLGAGTAKDLTTEELALMIQSDDELIAEFDELKKKEKKNQMLTFILRFNQRNDGSLTLK